MEGMLPVFGAWMNFYVIVGSSAAALTGLQFVVIVLAAGSNALSATTMRAFGTPTVVHFCVALLISSILSAPWRTVTSAAICLGACGVAGLAYLAVVLKHATKQKAYKPVFEDWLWHLVLPTAAYISLLASALSMRSRTAESLFGVAVSAIFLLFIGIHNAWDAVTYIAIDRPREIAKAQELAETDSSHTSASAGADTPSSA
jgi:hypothetical protein